LNEIVRRAMVLQVALFLFFGAYAVKANPYAVENFEQLDQPLE